MLRGRHLPMRRRTSPYSLNDSSRTPGTGLGGDVGPWPARPTRAGGRAGLLSDISAGEKTSQCTLKYIGVDSVDVVGTHTPGRGLPFRMRLLDVLGWRSRFGPDGSSAECALLLVLHRRDRRRAAPGARNLLDVGAVRSLVEPRLAAVRGASGRDGGGWPGRRGCGEAPGDQQSGAWCGS